MGVEKQIHITHAFSFCSPFFFSANTYVHSVTCSSHPSYSLQLTLGVSSDTEFDHPGSKTLGVVSCVKNGREMGTLLPL